MADQRRSKRYELKLPCEVVRIGSRTTSQPGETRNVSSGGVFLTTSAPSFQVGEVVEYLISLPTGSRIGDVQLLCKGKVVRRDDSQEGVAATLERYEFVRQNRPRRNEPFSVLDPTDDIPDEETQRQLSLASLSMTVVNKRRSTIERTTENGPVTGVSRTFK